MGSYGAWLAAFRTLIALSYTSLNKHRQRLCAEQILAPIAGIDSFSGHWPILLISSLSTPSVLSRIGQGIRQDWQQPARSCSHMQLVKPEDHFDHLLHLLELELEADRKRFRDEIQKLALKERVRRGYTWWPLQVVKTGFMVGERAFVVLERPDGRHRDSAIKAGSPVRYYTTVPGVERPEYSGVVHWVKDRQVKVVLSARQIPSWSDVVGQGLDLEFDENSYKEMRLALERAQHAKGRLRELAYVLTGAQAPASKPPQAAAAAWQCAEQTHPRLNHSQWAALDLIDAAEDVAIIHGPPGTGKTTTLVAAIERIAATERQLLVCAPSNVAVDLLAERSRAAGLRVVRTGHISRVSDELLDLTLDLQVSQHPEHKNIRRIKLEAAELRRQGSGESRGRGRMDRKERDHVFRQAGELEGWARQLEKRIGDEVLDSAQVICCTLTGAAAEFLRDRTFRTVIVDEAAQALEPSVWIALSRAKRIIMAGDPFQLPPTVKSPKAERGGLNITMMERLLPHLPEWSALLTVQYRMHAGIMGFSNAHFYDGKLVAAPGVEFRGLPLVDEPAVRFIDTAGTGFAEAKNPETQSSYNADEYLLIATYLHSYKDKFADPGALPIQTELGAYEVLAEAAIESERSETQGPVEDTNIGPLPSWPTIALISPYREQVEQMRAEVSEDPLLSKLDIVIHTIDGFQGQERDWVLLSLVRSNAQAELGFLRDYRRMNVAMTRARLQLVVVGDSATIGNDAFYAKFLDYVERSGDYASAFTYMHSV